MQSPLKLVDYNKFYLFFKGINGVEILYIRRKIEVKSDGIFINQSTKIFPQINIYFPG